MSDLDFYPAVGFETKRHHISSTFEDKAEQVLEKLDTDYFVPDSWHMRNYVRIFCYIPVISTVIFIFHMVVSVKSDTPIFPKELHKNYIALRVRYIFEGLCLGALFIIPDIIATIWRNCSNRGSKLSNTNLKQN